MLAGWQKTNPRYLVSLDTVNIKHHYSPTCHVMLQNYRFITTTTTTTTTTTVAESYIDRASHEAGAAAEMAASR